MKHIALSLIMLLCASCAPASSVVKTNGKQTAAQIAEKTQRLQQEIILKQARILFLEQVEVMLRGKVEVEDYGVYEVVSHAGVVSLQPKSWYKKEHRRYKIVTVFWKEADPESAWQILSWFLNSEGDPGPIEAAKVKRSRRHSARRQIRGYWRALKRKCKK